MSTLTSALREAARRLNAGHYHNWGAVSTCNCGVLAQVLMGKTREDLRDLQGKSENFIGTYTAMARRVLACPSTDIPFATVVRTLFNVGLTQKDINQLEYLTNPDVAERFEMQTKTAPHKTHPLEVALYMNIWADILEEQELKLASKIAQRKTQPASVLVNK
jgi:hypothetical protein